MTSEVNIFIFRRDFRFIDNTSLNKLAQSSKLPIIPIFIFNHNQLTSKYASTRAISFMVGALVSLKVYLYYDTDDINVLEMLNKKFKINIISFNRDYTPYAKNRDDRIIKWCSKKEINIIAENDYSLLPMDREWRVFTPYYNHCLKELPEKFVIKNPQMKLVTRTVEKYTKEIAKLIETKSNISRKNALEILSRIKNNEFANYDKTRDYMFMNSTTRLSAYIKFGLVSIREVYNAVNNRQHGIIRELLWRDYYARIVYFNPRVLQRESLKQYELQWNNKYFEIWTKGQTGFPIVDAAMRELNTTGYMHNRCRMIVASFLVKDLHCDWRLGERYFATNLIDYDPSSNSGGWQGVSSVGADASQPYFRIMNPWRQAKKHDPDCIYIKHWIPELKDEPPKVIHNWFKSYNKSYIKPIIVHEIAANEYKQLYMQRQ